MARGIATHPHEQVAQASLRFPFPPARVHIDDIACDSRGGHHLAVLGLTGVHHGRVCVGVDHQRLGGTRLPVLDAPASEPGVRAAFYKR
jgi:hypothetical protein